ncbi:MAG TPA: ABC transporter substrate-binding protein [Thermodesulfobacteriota bacterium]
MARRLALLAALVAPWLAPVAAAAATVSITCGSVGVQFELCRSGAEAWARQSGHRVRVVSTPRASNEVLALYLQLLAAGSRDIDVLRIDSVWPGLLAPHLADLREHVDESIVAQHFPSVIEAATVEGRLVALPWFVDVGLLYYRKDLLEKYGRPVPATWQALTETAAAIVEAERRAGNADLWGFVFQGRPYEGLTCNALEWIASYGGGTIVDAHGRVTVNNPAAVEALTLASTWVGGIAPPGVLNYAEEESRGAFQSGRAVFMRNWPYAWGLANAPDSPVRGKVGVAPLPAGGPDGRHASTLGGALLAVSRYSAEPGAAADLVRYLTGAAEQKRAALESSLNPTLPALYRDPEILKANPFMAGLADVIGRAVARPARATGRRYNQVSTETWAAVHDTLAGRGTAQANLARLERTLERLRRGGRW